MDQSEILQAMGNPDFYPEGTKKVDVMETHISTLLLTDHFVYKIKKPVNFGFLDFTTLTGRKYFCEQEITLNQRLSPDVYLDVIPICRTEQGFAFNSRGKVVDYAVKMRRLPETKMLESLFREGKIHEKMIREIALLLISFHSRAQTNPEISIYGDPERIAKNTEENFQQTLPFIDTTLNHKRYNRIAAYTRTFIENHALLFQKRIDDQKIRDCHGDIRMEHICIEDPIVIFDCVEFNRRFRYSDVASDLAFLAMDLDFHDTPHFSRHLVKTYVEYTHDIDLLKLIRFYKCYRAYVRGKVECFKGEDPSLSPEDQETARGEAEKYFALAEQYAESRPYLVITSGLTGTGKSKLTETLARDLDLALYQSDTVRKELTDVPRGEHRYEEFGKGIYTPEISRRTYQTLLAKAETSLQKGHSVILDAAYLKRKERKKAENLAHRKAVPFFVIEVVCPEEVTRQRLDARLEKKGELSDGRWEIYLGQQKNHDPVTEFPSDRHIVVDTSKKDDFLSKIEKKILIDIET